LSRVSTLTQFTMESCLKPDCCPSEVARSINTCVGSKDRQVSALRADSKKLSEKC
jgi:hypothetical protein